MGPRRGGDGKNRQTLVSSTLDADLLVDSLGRGSPSPKWASVFRIGRPVTEEIKIDLGYATATFERHPGDLYGSIGAAIIGTPPERRATASCSAPSGSAR